VVDLETLGLCREILLLDLLKNLVFKIFQVLTYRLLFEEVEAGFTKSVMSLFEHFVIFAVGFLQV
jgi:hypothetical protein